jgi:glycosyltransferase involved in cell wall biosynthesis
MSVSDISDTVSQNLIDSPNRVEETNLNAVRRKTVAVIWQRFGPYHLARLAGASHVLARRGCDCTGIEVAGSDEYAWSTVEGRHVTLNPDRGYASLTRREIRTTVTKCLEKLDPVGVAVNGWSVPEALAATEWCQRRGRPVILMSETHEPSGRWWKEWLKRRRVRRCDAALVGGRWHADYLISLGFPRDRIAIGYDAVDNEFFGARADEARSREAEFRNQYGLPQRYFFANTRFIPRKNIDGLLRAFAQYRRVCEGLSTVISEPWKLVISGSGAMEKPWKSLAESLGMSHAVLWPGFVQYDALPIYYGLASAFIHPARREAWGLVVNEAAAAGQPLIVGNRVGAACELVEDDKNGYLVNADDVGELAAAMSRMSALETTRRHAMGRHSRQLVANLSSERFGEALWSAFEFASSAESDK